MASEIVRAAVYCRMSTTQQEDSIERQTSTIIPYAARKGYVLSDASFYTDEGIAGDEFIKRVAFQQLLADARAGRFDVILCDEISRLSRQKFTEFIAKVAHPLEEAGVTVDSVTEGPLGWEEIADLLKLTIFQTNASGESKKLSYRVLTGQANIARQGRLLGGVRPYGYKAEYETVTFPGRGPKLVPVRLIPDGYKAEIVLWIFQHYDAGRMSISDLSRELNERRMAPPARNNRRRDRRADVPTWTKQTVTAILKNPAYVGSLAWNRARQGKYHRLTAGTASKTARPRSPRRNSREDWVVVEGTHEAIVGRDLFDRVQERLASSRGGKRMAARRGYLLGGLLTCGHCGRTLRGKVCGKRLHYQCQGYDNTARQVCGFGRVQQEAVVRLLLRVLRQELLDPERVNRLRADIACLEAAEEAPDRQAALDKAVADLTARIDHGRTNLAILPADMVPGVVETIRGWERERENLLGEIARLGQRCRTNELEEHIAEATAMLWRIEEAAGAPDSTLLADALRQLVAKVEFCWDRCPRANGTTRYVLTGGVIHLRAGGLTPTGAMYPKTNLVSQT